MRTLVITAFLLSSAAGAGAASLDIAFTDADGFIDSGATPMDRERNLTTLATHLRKLAAERLPADQRLQIEVTEVDLAGRVTLSAHSVRVATGGADWPRIDLRYTLQADGRTLASGSERIGDMYYLQRVTPLTLDEPLGREKLMLDNWFAQRFVPAP
jgi:hypothetical protein